eukprot:CAMPEP_0204630432 /NCGR_PEP_ID=MMETSP0717-20131115/20455_1 /ASSEMBLY_ACC=CAM_ASM_000666 /TAXON_ID=230516 /ORGANISM="Chaetoceros curvisetus" /LENGTH=100 /DNA_ID=CAMNT_0051647675 /DNA_START=223 /DNA_END=525 /DNA_ORIENTATION=-
MVPTAIGTASVIATTTIMTLRDDIHTAWDREATRSELSHLLPDQFLKSDPTQFLILEPKVKRSMCDRFSIRIVQRCKEGMSESIFYLDTLNGVNSEHFGK